MGILMDYGKVLDIFWLCLLNSTMYYVKILWKQITKNNIWIEHQPYVQISSVLNMDAMKANSREL